MTSPDLAAALRVAARSSRLLVASDYDGCLSPIIADPARAVPHPGALEAFLCVAAHDSVHAAIVSGRSPEVLEQFVGTHPQIELVGNHGSELDTVRLMSFEALLPSGIVTAKGSPGSPAAGKRASGSSWIAVSETVTVRSASG